MTKPSKVDDLDIESIITAARITEKSVTICLRGDLLADHEAAVAALNAANQRVDSIDDDALDGGARAESQSLAREVQRIEAEMTEASVTFRFRAMPPAEWSALSKRHEKGDGQLDDSWYPEVVAESSLAPKMSLDQVRRLREKLSDGQDDLFVGTAIAVNKGHVNVPKSHAASVTLARLDS